MKYSYHLLRLFSFSCFLLLFSMAAAAQNTVQGPQKIKQYVYEFKISGLTSKDQAVKMDSSLTGKKSGIVKWETDYFHKKVKVTTSIYIEYKDLMLVCKVNNCEASEEHTVNEIEVIK